MINLPIWVLLALIAGLGIVFVLGWNLSVYAFRDAMKREAQKHAEMAQRWEELANMMRQEPMRAGIDIGKDHIITIVESFARELRADMEA